MLIPKRILAFLGLMLMTALLAFSDAALLAAAEGLKLWWTAVLPSLFPFYVGTSLLLSGGAFDALSAFLSRPGKKPGAPSGFAAAFLIGAAAGYPTGARLARDCQRPELTPFVNLCSPIFLIGIVGGALLGNPILAVPILIAHYASAAIAYLLFPRARRADEPTKLWHAETPSFSLIEAIADGMAVMLRIGGCIVFFLVLSALLKESGISRLVVIPFRLLGLSEDAALGCLTGIFEFTGGCRALALAGLTPRLRIALLTAIVTFGGFCVYLQACLFLPPKRLKGYLVIKLVEALIAFLIAYLLAQPFLAASLPVMTPDGTIVKENAIAGGALFCISAAAMAFIYLVSVFLREFSRSGAREA